MFKFMKTKKGFSLVELMIVVVIMAILVAVAVPIFNSVTGNARAKTCIDNQRTIISTLNTALIPETLSGNETFQVKYDGKTGSYVEFGGSNTIYKSANDLNKVFQTVPYCPQGDEDTPSLINVTIIPGTDGMPYKIETECVRMGNDERNPHKLTSDSWF